MENATVWVHPTRYSGEYPSWAGYAFLDWDSTLKVYHPGEDYNWGVAGNDDLGQDVKATSSGIVVHTSKSDKGYGNLVVIKHTLGYNIKRLIKETYNIETNEVLSLYAHLNDIAVSAGAKLNPGDLIAHVGKSGTQWAHLHFEIFAPIGELQKTDWRFYPIGWSKEKVQQYYLPAYKFIEATKNLEAFETFLGKSKDYWLQVEKDRENLLAQLGDTEKKWALKLEEAEKQISTAQGETAKARKEHEEALGEIKKVEEKVTKKEEEIKKLNTRIAEILAQEAKKYTVAEAWQILISAILKRR